MKIQHDKIELRSEGVRNIIGSKPPLLIRIGNIILICLYSLLFSYICSLSFPYYNNITIFEYILSLL